MRPLDLGAIAEHERGDWEAAVRSRVQTAYLGQGVVLARVLGSHKAFLHTDDLGFATHVMLDGFWESWLSRFLVRLARPGMVAVDVGANYGYYTLLLCDRVGQEGRVAAFEPNPRVAELLTKSVAVNGFAGRCRIHRCCAGRRGVGPVMLHIPDGDPKNASVVAQPAAGGMHVEVPTVALDDALAEFGTVDLVKIDAEGAEEDVIDGFMAIIRRCRPHIVLEFNARRYAEPRRFLDRLLALYGPLQRVGYDGLAEPADPAEVAADQSGADVLLYFARP